MKRTTILADEGLLLEAKWLAERQGKTLAALVQDALREYVDAHWPPRRLPFVGMGSSGESDVSRRHHEILAAEIDPVAGWSPDRDAGSVAQSEEPVDARA